MRVIVTVSGFSRESAGPSYSVTSLCCALQKAGVSVELHALRRSDREYPFPVVTYRHYDTPLLARLGWSRDMARGMAEAARRSEVIHMNGVWMMPDVYPALMAKGTECKVVCCPHGGLSKVTLARNRMVKWVMWHLLGQKAAFKQVSMFHAASEKECEEIRALGFRQPVAIIPNGLELPKIAHRPFAATGRKLVFFGRIHPTKAVDHLVDAWGRVAHAFPDWSLEIAGPDCGAVPALKAMIAERGIPRVNFVGELHGDEKYKFLADADLYVLPSLTENFGITIAEALACCTPVIASKGCPWAGLEAHECGWWIDIGPDALAETLRNVLALPSQTLEQMGERGRAWISSGFAWEDIGRKMLTAYEWLLHGGDRPEFVDVVDEYGAYRQPLALRIKNTMRRVLKSSAFGKAVYPFFQKCWRAYAIPKRQRRLQQCGPMALMRLHQLMQKHGVPYYCDYGTLIGFVRDHGFIKHDDDIDISIRPEAMVPAAVLKIFMDAGYGYVHGFDYEGRLAEFTVADVSGVTIDVFFPTRIDEGRVHGYQPIWDPARQYPSEKANTMIQYDFVEATDIKTIEVAGVSALIPGNYDEVLTSEYGPWKVPDAKFNTVADRVHRVLPGFAYRLTQEEALGL